MGCPRFTCETIQGLTLSKKYYICIGPPQFGVFHIEMGERTKEQQLENWSFTLDNQRVFIIIYIYKI